MAEKIIYGRSIQKHDTEANWLKATNFIPKQGEIIIYDKDDNYNYERIKIGDDVTLVSSLPFVDDALRTALLEQISSVDNKVDAVSALVGDTAVATQINTALLSSQADFNVTDETSPSFIKNKPTEEDAINLLISTGFIIPVTNNAGDVLTDDKENILSL